MCMTKTYDRESNSGTGEAKTDSGLLPLMQLISVGHALKKRYVVQEKADY